MSIKHINQSSQPFHKPDYKLLNENNARNFSDWSSGNYQTDKKRLEEMGFIVYPVSVYDHSGWNMFIGKHLAGIAGV